MVLLVSGLCKATIWIDQCYNILYRHVYKFNMSKDTNSTSLLDLLTLSRRRITWFQNNNNGGYHWKPLTIQVRLFLIFPLIHGRFAWGLIWFDFSFVVSNCEFATFPLVSWVMCGTWLYRFLIFASLLTLKQIPWNTTATCPLYATFGQRSG